MTELLNLIGDKKLKILNFDKTQRPNLWQNSETWVVTKLKNEIVRKLKKSSNYDKTKNTQIMT